MRSVSYDGSPSGGAPHRHHVRHPRRPLFGRARPARAINRLTAANQLGLHEQIAECRMRLVLGLRRQDDLRIAGDLDGARRLRAIRQRHASQFNVILGRDTNLGVRFDLVVGAAELSPRLREDRLIASWRASSSAARRWTTARRCPHRANSRSCRSNRASHPRANASPPGRASGYNRRRRWSRQRGNGRWRADGLPPPRCRDR